MRSLGIWLVCAACTSSGGDTGTKTYPFGPFTIASHEEVTQSCVQISLNNERDMYVSSVELTTGTGFHHSNWFFVPDHVFFGDDGTFNCADRAYSEPTAAIFGGVLFAQSTQSPHEVQAFPEGVAIKIPPHSKLIAQIHLLNATDDTLSLKPNIKLTTIAEQTVATLLAGVSFENHALGLPSKMQSRFTLECDIATLHQQIFHRAPDFKIYYALAHYHALGTGLTMEAVRPDGTSAMVFTTASRIGDTLGGPIDPVFDMTGFSKLRWSCSYYNPTDAVVKWGVGDQEMCVFLAFSDSTFNWGGGVTTDDPPGDPTNVDGVMNYTHACAVFANDAQH